MTNLFLYITRTYEPEDYIGITINTETLPLGPVYTFKKLKNYNVEEMWSMISAIYQSAREFKVDNNFTIKIVRVRAPVGFGRDEKIGIVNSKSIIKIINSDGKCFPRALAVALVHAKKLEAGDNCSSDLKLEWENVRKSNRNAQLLKADELIRCAGVNFNRERDCGIPEITAFQKYFKNNGIALMVYFKDGIGNGVPPLFNGVSFLKKEKTNVKKILNILYYPAL